MKGFHILEHFVKYYVDVFVDWLL